MTDRPGNYTCDTSGAAAFVHQVFQRLEAEKAQEGRLKDLSDPGGAAGHGYLVVWRSCGNRQPVRELCSDPLCVACEKVRSQRRREKWLPVLQAMHNPHLITLTVRSGADLAECIKGLQLSFRRFQETRLGSTNLKQFRGAALDFAEKHYAQLVDKGELTESEKADKLLTWEKSLSKFDGQVKAWHVKKGKWPKMRHMIGPGFASLEITYTGKGWHVHRHLCTDGKFIPWPLLCAVWLRCTSGAFITDIRSIDKTDEGMKEAAKYVTKGWEIPEAEHDDFRSAIKGIKRIWPLGYAKPKKVKHVCPYCGDESCTGRAGEKALLLEAGNIWGMKYKLFELELSRSRFVVIKKLGGSWADVPLLDTQSVCAAGQSIRGP